MEADNISVSGTADRMIDEIKATGNSHRKCFTEAHAIALMGELEARGYTATNSGLHVNGD